MARRPSSMADGAAARALDHRVRPHHVHLAPSPRAPLDAHDPPHLPLTGANLVLVRVDRLRVHAGTHLPPRISLRPRVAVARRRLQNAPRSPPAQVCIWRQIAQTGWVSTWLWTSALTIDWILLLLHKRATSRARHRHRIVGPCAPALRLLLHLPPAITGSHVSRISRGRSLFYSPSLYLPRPRRSCTQTSRRTASFGAPPPSQPRAPHRARLRAAARPPPRACAASHAPVLSRRAPTRPPLNLACSRHRIDSSALLIPLPVAFCISVPHYNA